MPELVDHARTNSCTVIGCILVQLRATSQKNELDFSGCSHIAVASQSQSQLLWTRSPTMLHSVARLSSQSQSRHSRNCEQRFNWVRFTSHSTFRRRFSSRSLSSVLKQEMLLQTDRATRCGSQNPVNCRNKLYSCCCWSPSSSTMTLHCY